MEFFRAVQHHAFLQHALLTGLLAGIACGVVGPYVVTRRITYLAGAVAHCVLGGMGAARYMQVVHGWTWFHPLYGALLAALASAMTVGLVTLRARQREDTAISAVWAVGIAAGILFITRTPGYHEDLMSYLFGNILMVSRRELRLLAGLDVVVVGVVVAGYHQFLSVCFDEEFASLRGLPVPFHYLLLLALTALTVVLLVTVVGIVLVIALLTLPAAAVGRFCSRLWQVMIGAGLLSVVLTTTGLALSYGPDWPPGATIILLAAAGYGLSLPIGGVVQRLRAVHRLTASSPRRT